MHHFFLHFSLTGGTDELPLSPYLRGLDVESYQRFDYFLDVGVGLWVPLPIDRLELVKGLVLTTNQEIDVRLYGQTDGQINVEADGLLVLWDTNLRTITQPTVEVQNAGQLPARLQGIAVGVGLEEE